MMGIDPERATLYKLHDILRRLRPLVSEIADRDLALHSPQAEADQLKYALLESLKQMESHLDTLDAASNHPL